MQAMVHSSSQDTFQVLMFTQ
ncbi:hypothetical protein MTR67_010716 [Solanum verrucosum]|uniref:Uncharacterized protein n=1 Tax=Solanum verrucosum TaxID=315347 RepID=A0AAF0TFJ0_SOLVR|nr:hypothetical protein MTR67_010716 [Solanum verrucosum]